MNYRIFRQQRKDVLHRTKYVYNNLHIAYRLSKQQRY